ncbi:leucine-rich repeat domain-containing protein [Curvibacter cyanobacteriorum]|nr:hypothetical protein [Curvibacter sp. HBC61]
MKPALSPWPDPCLTPCGTRPSRLERPGRLKCGLVGSALVMLSSAVPAALPAPQTQALISLYQATQGPQWRRQDGWLQGDPCAQRWLGVRCNPEGTEVIGLHLPGNQLEGPLPEALRDLRGLQTLDLRHNLRLSGPLPAWSAWPQLQSFNVSFNQFSGPLPPLSDLHALQSLVVSNNLLTGPLPALTGLTALRNLRVNHNQLSGPLPPWDTPKLVTADLSFNRFTGPLPPWHKLPALETLVLDWNRFAGPLPPLPPHSALRTLSASGNQLSGPLPPFTDQPALAVLQLDHNLFQGPLPLWRDLPALGRLNLSYNQLHGSVPALTSLPALQSLQLQGNQLSGPLPPAPASLSQFILCPNAPAPNEAHEAAAPHAPDWPERIQCTEAQRPSQRGSPNPTPTLAPPARGAELPDNPPSPPLLSAPGGAHDRCHETHPPRRPIPQAEAACLQAPGRTQDEPSDLLDDSMLPPLSEWMIVFSGLLALATALLIWNLRISPPPREREPGAASAPPPATAAAASPEPQPRPAGPPFSVPGVSRTPRDPPPTA